MAEGEDITKVRLASAKAFPDRIRLELTTTLDEHIMLDLDDLSAGMLGLSLNVALSDALKRDPVGFKRVDVAGIRAAMAS